MLNKDTKFCVSQGVRSQVIHEEVVLLNLKTRRYFGISEVGKYIWEQLLEGASHQEICDRVAQKYGKQSFEVCADVDAFVHSLIAHELVAVGG